MNNYHLRSQCRIVASTTTQTRQCVEHTRAREADHRDHDELEHGRRVPRDDHFTDLALAVHPTRWAISGEGAEAVVVDGAIFSVGGGCSLCGFGGVGSFVVFLGVGHGGRLSIQWWGGGGVGDWGSGDEVVVVGERGRERGR